MDLSQTPQSVFATMYRRNKTYFWGATILTALFFVLGIIFAIVDSTPVVMFQMLIFPAIIWGILYSQTAKEIESEFLSSYASNHGLVYTKEVAASELTGSLFKCGHDSNATDSIAGNYHGHQSLAFLYNFTVGSGKNSSTYYFTVLQFDLSGMVPPLLIMPHADGLLSGNGFDYLEEEFNGDQKVDLEGDFNQHYTVRTRGDVQVEVREILTPDIMEQLESSLHGSVLEFTGDKLYVYCPSTIKKAEDLDGMYGLASYLAGKLANEIKGFQGDPEVVAANLNRRSSFLNFVGVQSILVAVLMILIFVALAISTYINFARPLGP